MGATVALLSTEPGTAFCLTDIPPGYVIVLAGATYGPPNFDLLGQLFGFSLQFLLYLSYLFKFGISFLVVHGSRVCQQKLPISIGNYILEGGSSNAVLNNVRYSISSVGFELWMYLCCLICNKGQGYR